MTPIDAKLLKKFIRIAGEKLEGDWVIIGGTLLPLLGIDHRVTVDIDIVAVNKTSNSQNLQLMEIAEQLGMSVEVINQTGALFLHRIEGFKQQLVLLGEGTKARLFRPNLELFIKLKVARFNETDLADCLEYLRWCTKNAPHEVKKEKLERLVKAANKNANSEKINRLLQLQKIVEKIKSS